MSHMLRNALTARDTNVSRTVAASSTGVGKARGGTVGGLEARGTDEVAPFSSPGEGSYCRPISPPGMNRSLDACLVRRSRLGEEKSPRRMPKIERMMRRSSGTLGAPDME